MEQPKCIIPASWRKDQMNASRTQQLLYCLWHFKVFNYKYATYYQNQTKCCKVTQHGLLDLTVLPQSNLLGSTPSFHWLHAGRDPCITEHCSGKWTGEYTRCYTCIANSKFVSKYVNRPTEEVIDKKI